MWSIGLETPEDSWGLFVDLEQERGRHHDSQTVEQHHGGQTSSVRHLHDAQGTPQPFTEWLRAGNQARPSPCSRTRGQDLLSPGEASRLILDRRIIAMSRHRSITTTSTRRWLNTQSLCDALTALIRAHDQGQMSQGAETIRGFLDDNNEPPYRQHLRDKTIQHAFVLLPGFPSSL